MFCENCGKSLIRGYQFCLECGTPVPPQSAEEDEVVEQAAEPVDEGMPQVGGGSGGDGGTLVFCPTCGMHMQKSGAYCEKCGMQLQSNSNDQYNNLPKNGDVPLWNTESEDYGYANLNDGEIEQINKFMSGGGITVPDDDYEPVDAVESISGFDAIGSYDAASGASEIESLTNQFANMYPSTNTEMPAIGGTVKENGIGERMMDNFAMESTNIDDAYIESGHLPVIEGASMEYDPNEPEPEDPNAFVMTDDAIEDITPTYDDIPASTEPEEEAPVYEDNSADVLGFMAVGAAAAAATYEPEVAEEIPAYEPEVAEEVPAYEEPVAYEPEAAEEVPAYEEPAAYEPEVAEEVPAYEEPAAYEPGVAEEIPAYEEPAAYEPEVAEEVPAYEEPVAAEEDTAFAIPVYGEDGETAEENYVYDNGGYDASDVNDIPLFDDEPAENKDNDSATAYVGAGVAAVSDIPAYSETEPAPMPQYEEPEALETEPVQDSSVFDEPEPEDTASGFMAAAVTSSTAPAKPSDSLDTKAEADLGRLIYCRNCGQDMYEKELVCQNCGAPKRPEYQRPSERKIKKESKPFKLFGIFSIPSLVAVAVIAIVIGAILLPSLTADKEDMTSKPNTTTSSTTTTATIPDELDAGGAEPDVTTTQSTATEPVPSQPVEDNEPEDTTATTSASTSATTPATSETSRTTPTSTAKPTSASTTSATTVATPATQGGGYYSSSTVISQNKERDALISAYETIAGEIGKVDAFARNTVYAMAFDDRGADTAAKSFYAGTFGSAAIKSISAGKSTVSAAVSAAKPSSGELSKAYNALKGLEDIYVDYCNYVVGATSFSKYESSCDDYMSRFRSYAKKNFSFSALNTSAQTNADRAQYFADVIGEAANAVDNAASAYSTLNSKIGKLTESTFSGKFLDTLGSNVNTYMKAAKYTYAAQAYYDILSGSSYAGTASSYLNSGCGYLTDMVDIFALAPYDNTLANFKSTINTYVSSATNAAANARSNA